MHAHGRSVFTNDVRALVCSRTRSSVWGFPGNSMSLAGSKPILGRSLVKILFMGVVTWAWLLTEPFAVEIDPAAGAEASHEVFLHDLVSVVLPRAWVAMLNRVLVSSAHASTS
jgi:hypothetical protein